MWDISPTLVRYDDIEPISGDVAKLGLAQLSSVKAAEPSSAPLKKPISDFYLTNPIARASVTMAACSKAFVKQDYTIPNVDSKEEQVGGALKVSRRLPKLTARWPCSRPPTHDRRDGAQLEGETARGKGVCRSRLIVHLSSHFPCHASCINCNPAMLAI
jgi:hypothetical protein